ncbi:metallophosphoesterase family protein [Verrucomicrobiaceae bacterium R5-34]|uniref:Metallophosphoesterase family protein n=1 Tax=Oceaniferula flava TaxID=2800421 RepID=A0AAE2SF68_9BACT|nr:metallophosphoesterase family protein [Oceaniferula flavus]MBK1832155.1 metallophosphoesterase family protein [Verrucomicrobiaceae bacterium R5-34]MBK1856267.1 metallophosphoesterase family protein [Oceaniferula flavus]MBM1137574.1 metallophosphoesterase family protein [Oceaniferula flavus]
MKYGIISDIHANLEALTSVIKDANEQGVKRFICLGDIVGYNANPAACVDIIRGLNCAVVKGNHDAYASGDEIPEGVNGRARASLEWTRDNLRPAQVEWLKNLPMSRRVGTMEIVHASLYEPENWHYVVNGIEAILHFHFQKTRVCFFGHIHQQIYFSTEARRTNRDFEKIELTGEHQFFVNVGSVGQPRSDDKRAEYVILDTVEECVESRKVEYDIESACEKIRQAGLPEHNALRLQIPDDEIKQAMLDQLEEPELAS